jgi:TonB family protein
MILQHELTHIERADWAGYLLAPCVHALYWPVPRIPHLMRQLSLSIEPASDDRVLATGVPAPRCAAMLLRQARGNRVPATVSLGYGSELNIRIRKLVVEIVDHSVIATGNTATLLASLALCVPLAAMQIGSRGELPELTRGGANPKKYNVEPSTPLDTMQFDESATRQRCTPGPNTRSVHPRPRNRPSSKGKKSLLFRRLSGSIEVYVDLAFDIAVTGLTTNIRVIAAQPEGVFNRAAIAALKKWKYQVPVIEGAARGQAGMMTRIRFELKKNSGFVTSVGEPQDVTINGSRYELARYCAFELAVWWAVAGFTANGRGP